MAIATKTLRSLLGSTSNAAGATTNSSAWDLRTAIGGTIVGRITNGGTGPTLPCEMVVQISTDGTNWYEDVRFQQGNLAPSAVNDFAYQIKEGTLYARAQFTGNTGQAVTVFAEGHELTAVV